MGLIIRWAFLRDWDNSSSRELSKAIEEKKNEVKAAKYIGFVKVGM